MIGDGRISAIVVSYFTGPTLTRSLRALFEQCAISEIVLVNNGNHRGALTKALATVEECGSAPIKILSGHGNIGFAAACNKAARAASGEYLLFINPDAVLEKDGAERLLRSVSSIDQPWLIAPMLVDPAGREQQGSRRNVLTPTRALAQFTQLYRLPRAPQFNLHKTPAPDGVAAVPVISGACFLTPAESYWSVGGMDEDYFLHVEDVDLCVRFAGVGGVYFNPDVKVTHFQGASRASATKVERAKAKSMAQYFTKHFSKTCPAPVLWGVGLMTRAAIEARLAVYGARQSVRLVFLAMSHGPGVIMRARRMFNDRSQR